MLVGIQVFSNIDTLDALQKKLEEQSKQFEAHVNAVMKLRADDLKNLQLEMVKSSAKRYQGCHGQEQLPQRV